MGGGGVARGLGGRGVWRGGGIRGGARLPHVGGVGAGVLALPGGRAERIGGALCTWCMLLALFGWARVLLSRAWGGVGEAANARGPGQPRGCGRVIWLRLVPRRVRGADPTNLPHLR